MTRSRLKTGQGQTECKIGEEAKRMKAVFERISNVVVFIIKAFNQD